MYDQQKMNFIFSPQITQICIDLKLQAAILKFKANFLIFNF